MLPTDFASGLAQTEDLLSPTALALRGMRPPRFAERFAAFAKSIPFQQVSRNSNLALVGRWVERFGTLRAPPLLLYSGPESPEKGDHPQRAGVLGV